MSLKRSCKSLVVLLVGSAAAFMAAGLQADDAAQDKTGLEARQKAGTVMGSGVNDTTTPSNEAAAPSATRERAAAAQEPVDDTGQNTKHSVNADQQSNKDSDIATVAKIRREIVADDQLSQYAKNVKIVVQDGNVNLVGPVRSADEKTKVEEIARRIVGQDKVTSGIEVKAH